MKQDPMIDELKSKPKKRLSGVSRREILHELKQEEARLDAKSTRRKGRWLPPGKGMTYAATVLLFPVIAIVMWLLLEGSSDVEETMFFQGEQVNITSPEEPDETALAFHFEQHEAGGVILDGSPDSDVARLIAANHDIGGIERFGRIEGAKYDFYGYYYVDNHRRLHLAGAVTIDSGAEDEQYLLEVFSVQIDESTLRTFHDGEQEMMTMLNDARHGQSEQYYLFGLGFSPKANVEDVSVEGLDEIETLIADGQLIMFGFGDTLERHLEVVMDGAGLDMFIDRLDTELCLEDGSCHERTFLRHPLLPDY